MSLRVQQFATSTAADEHHMAVIRKFENKRPVVRSLNVSGAHANVTVSFFACRPEFKTTVQSVIAATDNIFELDADVASPTVNNRMNGVAITATDFVLLRTNAVAAVWKNGPWELINITSLGATASTLDVDGFSVYNGITATEISGDCAVGNEAYVIPVEDVFTIPIGIASVYLEYPFAGYNGAPAVIACNSGDATLKRMSGVVFMED